MHYIFPTESNFELGFCKITDSIAAGRDFSEKMFSDKRVQMTLLIIGKTIKTDAEPLEKIVHYFRLNCVKDSRFDFDFLAMAKQWENYGNPITFFDSCRCFKKKAVHAEIEDVCKDEFVVPDAVHPRKSQTQTKVLSRVSFHVALDEGVKLKKFDRDFKGLAGRSLCNFFAILFERDDRQFSRVNSLFCAWSKHQASIGEKSLSDNQQAG